MSHHDIDKITPKLEGKLLEWNYPLSAANRNTTGRKIIPDKISLEKFEHS